MYIYIIHVLYIHIYVHTHTHIYIYIYVIVVITVILLINIFVPTRVPTGITLFATATILTVGMVRFIVISRAIIMTIMNVSAIYSLYMII